MSVPTLTNRGLLGPLVLSLCGIVGGGALIHAGSVWLLAVGIVAVVSAAFLLLLIGLDLVLGSFED